MNLEKLSIDIERVTFAIETIKRDLLNGKMPDKNQIIYVMNNKDNLTIDQNHQLENILIPKINQLSSFENALVISRQKNPFTKLPIIKNIVKYTEDKKREKMLEEMHIKDGIYADKISSMNSKDKKEILQQETVVISDLHGKIDKWEFVKEEIKNNPFKKFVILGDAMDRVDYGVEILLEIKELSDKGKVQYLPGNHDLFAYNYLKCKGKNPSISDNAKKNLEYNGGQTTINKLENFDQVVANELANKCIDKPITLQELTDWLGRQSIQTIIHENGINYALAHAIFDTDLYNTDKDFNLEKALNIQINQRKN